MSAALHLRKDHLGKVTFVSVSRIGIAVAGASCSGKTTLANAIASETDATLLRIDDYYRPLDHLTYEERCLVNFDAPCAIDTVLLLEHFRSLLDGKSIEAPRYDFTRHTRFQETRTVRPAGTIIVDGLFALSFSELASLCEVRVFVDAPKETCLERRVVRDTLERGRTPEEVVGRFTGHVWPMYLKHIYPSRIWANVLVSGCQDLGRSLDRVLHELGPVSRAA